MLDGGGGGGGTPWESMSLEFMRQLIQNPNTDAQWQLASAWQKSADLLSEHRFQVQQYRDNLATAWPPEKSTASAAYLDRLDQLIKNLSDTYDASIANRAALSAATGSIHQAQVQVEKIYQEYANNKAALDAYNAKTVQQQKSATPTPSPSPSGDEPPVAPGRQEALRVQAAKLLSGVSTELAQAQAHIVKPTAYKVDSPIEDNKTIRDGNTYTAPALPPITPFVTGESTGVTRPTGTTSTFPISTPTTATPVTPTIGTQPGIVLGGASPTLPTSTPGISPIAPIGPGGGGPLPNPGLLPPTTSLLPGGTSPLTPTTPGIGSGGLGVPREGILRAGGLREGGMRAMAPGGIIGGNPGTRGLGQLGTGGAGSRRVNPVGGVIGESAGGVGSRRGVSGISAAEHPAGMYGQGTAARRSGRQDEGDDMRWDPDNPWATAEGVDPVVLPIEAQRVDPGPAIGLG